MSATIFFHQAPSCSIMPPRGARCEPNSGRRQGMPNVAIENFSRGREENLEQLRALFDESKNPLYLWEAVHSCLCPPDGYPRCALPNWCTPYFAMVASHLMMLSHFKDAKSFPENKEQETTTEYSRRWEEWNDRPAISAERACELIPWVMRFERKGWSAFKQYAADRKAIDEAAIFPVLARHGEQQAIDRLKKKFNLQENKSAKRLISRGLDLLRKRTKPTP